MRWIQQKNRDDRRKKISELEDKAIETIKYEQERKIDFKTRKRKPLCISGTMTKDLTSVVIGFPEERKECCGEKNF